MNIPKIRSFSGAPGSDIKSHLSKVRKHVRLRDIGDAIDQIDFLLNTLEGEALNYSDRAVRELGYRATFDELCKRLETYLSKYGSTKEHISRAWSTIQYIPGTPLDRFASDLEQLAEGLGYNAESVKNKLVECLPHHSRMFIRHEYSVSEIIKEAERVMAQSGPGYTQSAPGYIQPSPGYIPPINQGVGYVVYFIHTLVKSHLVRSIYQLVKNGKYNCDVKGFCQSE